MTSTNKGRRGQIEFAKLKELVRERFRRCCGYCGTPEELVGGKNGMEVDTFVPKSVSPSLQGNFDNLVYACRHCNARKGNRVLPVELHPGRAQYNKLLALTESGNLTAHDSMGEMLIHTLDLNPTFATGGGGRS